MIKGFNTINYRDYFEFELESRTRGHSFQIIKETVLMGNLENIFVHKEW